MNKKWFLKSKTVWFNALILALIYFGLGVGDAEGFGDWVQQSGGEELAIAGLPVMELLLRFITTQPVGSGGKSMFKSKTVMFNALAIGALLVLLAQPNPPIDTPVLTGLLTVAVGNLLLRFSTDSGVSVLPVASGSFR